MSEVENKHPEWTDRIEEWALMRHCIRGEKEVKAKGEDYLPMPSGFTTHADAGVKAYNSYRARAQFPEIVNPTIQGMVGVIHRTDAQVDLPKAMEAIAERATKDGLSLAAFHRRITAELLATARYSILVDAALEGSELPWLAGYSAESLINWDDDRTLFVLDESGLMLDGFKWEHRKSFRALRLQDGAYTQEVYQEGSSEPEIIQPSARGRSKLEEIPFVVIGATDLSTSTEEPPLMGVSRAAIAQYQLCADYRWQLFMSGQETLFIINADAPGQIGAGVVVSLKAGEGGTPDAKYVGPSGSGIEAHRTAISDQQEAAAAAGAKMFDTGTKAAESGDALKIRFAAQTATLISVAQASAAGLEKALRYVALMIGSNPDEVVVKPNLSFIDATLTPDQAVALMKLWQGSAISKQTLYENLQRGEIASADRSFEDEEDLIEAEGESLGMVGRTVDPNTGLPIDPNKLAPVDPEEETGSNPQPEPIGQKAISN